MQLVSTGHLYKCTYENSLQICDFSCSFLQSHEYDINIPPIWRDGMYAGKPVDELPGWKSLSLGRKQQSNKGDSEQAASSMFTYWHVQHVHIIAWEEDGNLKGGEENKKWKKSSKPDKASEDCI